MNSVTFCEPCGRQFHDDEGQLHPTLDAVICPHCGAVNLFVTTETHSWESYQESLQDGRWQAHHHPEDDDFYLTYVE
jgi:hypothetical protein